MDQSIDISLHHQKLGPARFQSSFPLTFQPQLYSIYCIHESNLFPNSNHILFILQPSNGKVAACSNVDDNAMTFPIHSFFVPPIPRIAQRNA